APPTTTPSHPYALPLAGSPYTITGSTGSLAAANYSFVAADGALTITRATLTVTADNQSREYGAANPTFSETITGYKNGENATSSCGAHTSELPSPDHHT